VAIGVSGTDFICIPVTDIERAREFYSGILGLEFGKQWGEMPGFEYETGNLTIALMQSDAFGQEFAPHTHPVALQVDDVEAARGELEEKGINFAQDTIDSGVCHMAFFADPDGNGLMLHHRYAPKGEKVENLEERVAAITDADA
jgi:catechol 2,3-dioxygenase-like lactoylglutathione lyase family enzyme